MDPNQPYTLMLRFKTCVFNIRIRKKLNAKYAIGEEKPDEKVNFL